MLPNAATSPLQQQQACTLRHVEPHLAVTAHTTEASQTPWTHLMYHCNLEKTNAYSGKYKLILDFCESVVRLSLIQESVL